VNRTDQKNCFSSNCGAWHVGNAGWNAYASGSYVVTSGGFLMVHVFSTAPFASGFVAEHGVTSACTFEGCEQTERSAGALTTVCTRSSVPTIGTSARHFRPLRASTGTALAVGSVEVVCHGPVPNLDTGEGVAPVVVMHGCAR
jgi:hypothetical protein